MITNLVQQRGSKIRSGRLAPLLLRLLQYRPVQYVPTAQRLFLARQQHRQVPVPPVRRRPTAGGRQEARARTQCGTFDCASVTCEYLVGAETALVKGTFTFYDAKQVEYKIYPRC